MELSDKTVVVCSIVRNAERGLRRNIPVIREFCGRFRDYRIVIFENDSQDKTVCLLESWAAADAKVNVVSRRLGVRTIPDAKDVACNPFFSRYRIEKMAAFRNQYLVFVEENGWNPDFLMVVDLDVERLDLSAILTSFDHTLEWDVVTAFGYSLSPRLKRRYHDSYALTELGQENTAQTELSIQEASERWGRLGSADPWVSVYSAFGGLAIYRYECVRGLRYQCVDNGDSRVEVRCEHFSLCKQMREKGFTRIFINPGMRLKYQRLSLKIIIGYIRRTIGGKG